MNKTHTAAFTAADIRKQRAQHRKERDEALRGYDLRKGNAPREPNLWQEIKHADTYDHSEYRSRLGVVAWWAKDGAWHVAIPGIDCFGKPGMLWTSAQFPNAESAMIAIERGEAEPIVAVTDAGNAPRETEKALKALIDAWIDERGCSRLIAAGYAADAAKREYEAISKRVNIPS